MKLSADWLNLQGENAGASQTFGARYYGHAEAIDC